MLPSFFSLEHFFTPFLSLLPTFSTSLLFFFSIYLVIHSPSYYNFHLLLKQYHLFLFFLFINTTFYFLSFFLTKKPGRWRATFSSSYFILFFDSYSMQHHILHLLFYLIPFSSSFLTFYTCFLSPLFFLPFLLIHQLGFPSPPTSSKIKFILPYDDNSRGHITFCRFTSLCPVLDNTFPPPWCCKVCISSFLLVQWLLFLLPLHVSYYIIFLFLHSQSAVLLPYILSQPLSFLFMYIFLFINYFYYCTSASLCPCTFPLHCTALYCLVTVLYIYY